jgi:hypothetical protein
VETDLRDARKHASKLSGEASCLAGEVSRLSASAEQVGVFLSLGEFGGGGAAGGMSLM